jgi:predicted thioesterase
MITEGITASTSLVVTAADTAVALRSGDVVALGTPRVVALCEQAAVAALAGLLPEQSTTVGTNINIDHLAATPVGGTVTASATVTAVDGRTISFSLVVVEGEGDVARGVHTRAVVDRKRFEALL